MTLRSRLFLVIGGLLLLVAGCSVWVPDLVEQRQLRPFERPHKIAVVPFYPSPLLSKRAKDAGTEAWEAAALVTRFVTEAIEERPVEVVPEHDMVIAFEGQGQVVPRREPGAPARLAHAEFGAEAILLGEVRRYRKREGSAYGSFSPASVEFKASSKCEVACSFIPDALARSPSNR